MGALTTEQLLIAQQYYSQLDLRPEQRSKPQFAICLIGLIGSGKSTFLDVLCKEVPLVRHSGDKVRTLLHQHGMPIDENALPIAREASMWLRRDGYNIAYDNDFGNPVVRQDLQTVDSAAGIAEIWVRLNPPYEAIVRNLRDDKHAYEFSALQRLTAQKAIHDANIDAIGALPFVYTLDYSRPDSSQQTREAIRCVKQAIAGL